MNLKVKVGERAQWTKRHVKARAAGSLGRRARRRSRNRAGGGGGKVVASGIPTVTIGTSSIYQHIPCG